MALVDRIYNLRAIVTTYGDKIMCLQIEVATLRDSIDSQVIYGLEGQVAKLKGQLKELRHADAPWWPS